MKHGKITRSMAHFCKNTCPVCTTGREKGEGFLYTMVKLEENLCPMCRSYKKVYGKPAHEKLKKDPNMKKINSLSGLPAGIIKLSEIDLAELEGKNTAIARILETREVRQALANILPDMLNVIAGDSRFKRVIMKMVGKFLNKSLSRPKDIFEVEELAPLFDDPQFIRHIAEPMPDLINGLFDLITAAVETIEHLDTDDKKEIFGDLVSKISTGQTGAIITRTCRIINDLHGSDPEFFTKALAPGFEKWIESVDFGELKEMVDNAGQDGRAFVEMVNHVIWQYPAKMVLLLSLIPSIANGLTVFLDISVGKLNELPPDLLTDVILSFINEVDAEPVAGVLNQLTEIVRKVHTGSALLGEPGAPQLPRVLSDMIEKIIDRTDPITLWKAKIALAETKATIGQAISESMTSRPNFKHLNIIMGPELTNIRLKALNQRLAAWDSEDDEELAKSFSQNLSAYDAQELAEVLNNTLRIINRLGDERPAIFTEFAAQVMNAIDDYELSETARRLFNGVSTEMKPAARAVVPGLVTWICDVLQPEDDEYEEDAEKARNALRSLLVKEEV